MNQADATDAIILGSFIAVARVRIAVSATIVGRRSTIGSAVIWTRARATIIRSAVTGVGAIRPNIRTRLGRKFAHRRPIIITRGLLLVVPRTKGRRISRALIFSLVLHYILILILPLLLHLILRAL